MTKKDETIRKILDASLIEFGTKGYELASTNAIYKAAKVSKGIIFLYFKSKAELFYAVFDECATRAMEEMRKLNFDAILDVYEKLVTVVIWKSGYYHVHPYDVKIFMEITNNPPLEIKDKLYQKLLDLRKLSFSEFFDKVDMSNISPEYTKEELIKYIQMALNGFQSISEKITVDNMDKMKEECMKYIQTILKGMRKL